MPLSPIVALVHATLLAFEPTSVAVVDRVEGATAIVELAHGDAFVDVPLSALPSETGEGTVLEVRAVPSGAWRRCRLRAADGASSD